MPTPEQLTQWPEALVKLYQQVEDDIIADMAKRINAQNYFIPAAQWQFKKLQEMGLARKEIYDRLATVTGKTKQHLGWMMRKAGDETLRSGQARAGWVDAGEFKMTEGLKKILLSGFQNTVGLFENLTRTTANTATHQLENALDRAWLQVKSGAFSHGEAVRIAIRDLSRIGVASIQYPSGHTDYVDTAVRRAVRTGVNQTAIKVALAQAVELGTDLVETTAHAGARPTHAIWQGKVFSISGTHKAYPGLRQGTGYGTGAGLGGWNCRHSINLFFEGQELTYTEDELGNLSAPKYEYNGKKLTQYEAEQQQRYNERQIRRWKRENVTMEAVGKDTSESAVKLSQWQQEQKRFLEQTGLKRRGELEQVVAFGTKQAGKAKSIQNAIAIQQQEDIIKTEIKQNSGIRGKLNLHPEKIDTSSLSFDGRHINQQRNHQTTEEDAKKFIQNASATITRWNGKFVNYFSEEGAAYVNTETGEIRTAFTAEEFDDVTKKLMKELKAHGK